MSEFILDEDFDYFLEKFGQPDWQHPVERTTLEYYRGKLPDRLLFYWEKMGFCRFKQGLFWIVNPADYEDELAIWLSEDILKQDNYYVIARSGFGKL
ncbi:GAD-like domain-containing protein [Psychrobacter sp. VH5]|uniref:GAD-like domain-containing protein n=1 Tax=Psychrobacter sp. VH5 TaxID=3423439 RepID=UPI003D64BAA1